MSINNKVGPAYLIKANYRSIDMAVYGLFWFPVYPREAATGLMVCCPGFRDRAARAACDWIACHHAEGDIPGSL